MGYFKQVKSLPKGASFKNGRYYANGFSYERGVNSFGEKVYYRHKIGKL